MGTIFRNGIAYSGGGSSNKFNENEFVVEDNVVSLKNEYLFADSEIGEDSVKGSIDADSLGGTSAELILGGIDEIKEKLSVRAVENYTITSPDIIRVINVYRVNNTISFNLQINGNITSTATELIANFPPAKCQISAVVVQNQTGVPVTAASVTCRTDGKLILLTDKPYSSVVWFVSATYICE